MADIGRNDPCTCGSGKKYKKCCRDKPFKLDKAQPYSEMSPELLEKYKEIMREQQLREAAHAAEYGFGRPIISAMYQGYRFVAVHSTMHYSKKWKTVPDFLFYYITHVLNKSDDWGKKEILKPLKDRHEILKWYNGLCLYQQAQPVNEHGLYGGIPSGSAAAYLHLAHDLYRLDDHQSLQADVVKRLKDPKQFQGARYELFVAAACIRAGYKLKYEDESDNTRKHHEFIGVHEVTGQRVAVEAKSRHRRGVKGFLGGLFKAPHEQKADIEPLLRSALDKPTTDPKVIFIDLNLPHVTGRGSLEKPWAKEIMDTFSVLTGLPSTQNPDKFNLAVFTNHPQHYARDLEPDPGKDTLSVFPLHPKIRPTHPESIQAIHRAADQYGKIPNWFEDSPAATD